VIRAAGWFERLGVTISLVITDNGSAATGRTFF
jgi:hypothetical protein